MSRRIDVELTSTRPDGTWTWRAAGARQPKGELDGSVLYQGAQVGDVVRAEADFDVEGITILSVTPPKTLAKTEAERIEVLGSPKAFEPTSSVLVPKGARGGERRDRGDRPSRGDRPGRGDGPSRGDRPGGGARSERPRGERSERPRRDARPERPKPEAAEPKPKAKRLNPGTTHRDAATANLSPEQQAIAEQILRGGIPAVRQAVEQQNAAAKAEGRPQAVKLEAIIAMAEELLPSLKTAEWRDRAEAAVKDVDEISLRDLRSVAAGADLARDDETRAVATTLREALERRTKEQREKWVAEVTSALDEGRVVRALRISSRPPDPTTRFPAELALRLAEAAGAGLASDVMPDRWALLLEAVAESPVRRTVKPAGIPSEPGEALLKTARQLSGRVPSLAALLGIDMPPPPGPARKIPRPPRAPRPAKAPTAPAAADATPSAAVAPAADAPESAVSPPQAAQSQEATEAPSAEPVVAETAAETASEAVPESLTDTPSES